MTIGDREVQSLIRWIERHESSISDIRVDIADLRAELRGAAKENARAVSLMVAAVGAIGVSAQIIINLIYG